MTRPDLCLEFANTRYWRGQDVPTETLNAPEDLAAWRRPTAPNAKPPAQREFERAIELRETHPSPVRRHGAGQGAGRRATSKP